MASQEIEEINSSNPEGCSSSSCIIQVDYELTMNEENILDVGEARIFRVPKPLRDSDRFYSPKFVSIGPFHYGKWKLKGMEKSKSEAVRRMEKRLQRKDPSASIKSFVEERIFPKDEEIRKFYGEHIPFPPIKLAWMVTRDACFVFEFLVNYVGSSDIGGDFYKKEVCAFSWKYDAVFDLNYQNPLREELMDDILLFENQIPLLILKDLLEIEMGSGEAANEKLDVLMDLLLGRVVRHNVFMWYTPYNYNESFHVLEVVYHGTLDTDISSYADEEARQLPPSRNSIQIFFLKGVDLMKGICGHWCKLCLRFSSNTSYRNYQQTPSSLHNLMQIWFKNGVNSLKVICGRWCKKCLVLPSNRSRDEEVKLDFLKLPTALELEHRGVKIHPVSSEKINALLKTNEGNGEGRPIVEGSPIEWIRFDDKTSTLYLPQMRVTQQSDLVMRNIIAMEVTIQKSYYPKPFTQFAMFMDELIDSKEDVAVLRKAEVINNFLGSDQQVANIFNSLAKGIAPENGCKIIFEARLGLYRYTRRKYKILYSEFVSAYFSKPWLVVGSMAAVLLLLMAVTKEFCMFLTCSS